MRMIYVALPEWVDASYQRSTRSALKVFHRLGVPSGSSNRKCRRLAHECFPRSICPSSCSPPLLLRRLGDDAT